MASESHSAAFTAIKIFCWVVPAVTSFICYMLGLRLYLAWQRMTDFGTEPEGE